MSTIADIYAEYRIFKGLQMHQLRVAAVAQIVATNSQKDVDVEACVMTGLLHDMGNIVKAKLDRLPELLEPEGIAYWQSVQEDYFTHYGRGEHEATRAILLDLGAPEKVLQIVSKLAFNEIPHLRDTGTIEEKICEYADLRVAPFGVVSIQERLEDGRKRYAHIVAERTQEQNELIYSAVEDIEKDLFSSSYIQPEYITDERVAPIIEALREFELPLRRR